MDRIRTTNILLLIIAGLAVITALKLAETVFVTVFVAFLLAYIMEIPVRLLRALKVPLWLAVFVTALVFFGILSGLGFSIYRGLRDFAVRLPAYQERLSELLTEGIMKLDQASAGRFQIDISEQFGRLPISSSILGFAQSIASSVVVFVVIYVFAILITYGKYYFPTKLIRAFPRKGDRRIPAILTKIDEQVRKYVGVKTLSSLIVGVVVGGITAAFGVDFVILWAFLGFVLNYIPAVGPFVSSALPAMIGLVQFGPVLTPFWIFAVLISVNMLFHNLIEPKFQGEVLNLSLLVVFVSLLYWGWLWGHLGVLLAVPMTSAVKIVFEQTRLSAPLAVLMEKPIKLRRFGGRKRTEQK